MGGCQQAEKCIVFFFFAVNNIIVCSVYLENGYFELLFFFLFDMHGGFDLDFFPYFDLDIYAYSDCDIVCVH